MIIKSKAQYQEQREQFKLEMARLREFTDEELVGSTPARLTRRNLKNISLETLALWYRSAQLEMESYDTWARARILSDRLDRIEEEITERLGTTAGFME